jgi:PAS domain S-box-containing protein
MPFMPDPRTEAEMADRTEETSDERFRLFVESVKDYAIFMLDSGGHIVSWNAGAQRIKGWTEQEIVGRHFSIFYTPDAQASRHPDHELEIAKAEGRYEEEGWRVRKDGSRFWANVVITALYDEDGTIRGFGKVTRDMTERRETEEHLREARAELARREVSERHAIALNDNIVQGLAVAQYSLEQGDADRGRIVVERTLQEASKIISALLSDAQLDAGQLRRDSPAPGAAPAA